MHNHASRISPQLIYDLLIHSQCMEKCQIYCFEMDLDFLILRMEKLRKERKVKEIALHTNLMNMTRGSWDFRARGDLWRHPGQCPHFTLEGTDG